MLLPKSYITAFFLLTIFVTGTALATFKTIHAQNYQDTVRSRASATVPGIIDGINDLLGANPASFKSSALGQVSHLIAMPYANPPASGIQYIASLKNNFAFTSKAYAAPGDELLLGYNGLLPIQPLWTMFRNIAYLGFVLMFIIIGFMIMLRVKLDPRTVVTVQQAIPSIIIGLILVTFSYAIVGFMIDLMFLFIALMVQIFISQGVLKPGTGVDINGVQNASAAQNALFNKNVLELARSFWGSEIRGVADHLGEFVDEMVSTVFSGVAGNIAGFITKGVMQLILLIALLYAAIRTFISMIIAYVSVIILTIVGPLQILIGVIPGQGGNGFGKWLRNVAGNLAIFPVIAFLILLAAILTDSGDTNFDVASPDYQVTSNDALWRPPLLFGSVNKANDIKGIVGLGIILLIPAAAQMTKDLFKNGGFAYGAAIGSTIGAGAATVSGPVGIVRSGASEATKNVTSTAITGGFSKVFGRSRDRPPAV